MADHQAQLQVTQSTLLAVIARVASLLLILALVHHLIGLYRRGLALAIDYEAMADAALIGSSAFSTDPERLRQLFTPRLDEAAQTWRGRLSNVGKSAPAAGDAAH